MSDAPPPYAEKASGYLGFEDLLEKQQFHFKWVGQSDKAFSELFSPDETVRDVKEKICQRVPHLEWTDLKLSLPDKGGFLKDKELLSACGIPPYARILIHGPNMTAKPPAKPASTKSTDFQVFIKMFDGRTITVWVNSLSTVRDLKVEVKEKDGLGEEEQRLLFGGKELGDPTMPLREYNIQKENTIHLVGRLQGGIVVLRMYR